MTEVRAAAFFGPDGRLARAHTGYEHRVGQQRMAEAVQDVLARGGALMIEAGTGTGKTLAYLVPAIASGRRVVISTGTRNLQDQIFRRDLPFLRDSTGLRFSATLMKGRDNYLCVRRAQEFWGEPLLEIAEEGRWVDTVREWSRDTATGDRAEMAELPDRLRFWKDVNARADTCGGSRCPDYDTCFLTRMKRAAQDADLVVVNHHLFFADLAVRSEFGAVIPEYDAVVFDEAHLLEEIATSYFGESVGSAQIEDLARDAERLAARHGATGRGGGGAAGLRLAAAALWAAIDGLSDPAGGRVRFASPDRGGPRLDDESAALRDALHEVGRVASAGARAGDDGEALARRADDLADALERVLDRRDPAFVYSLERRGKSGVIMAASPIDVSAVLRDGLFSRLHAAVLTSATLAVDGSFAFFRDRLGIEQPREEIVESEFDHAAQARLYLPERMPEPRDPEFARRALEEIEGLLAITRGRAFVLFTSFAMLERVRAGLARSGRWQLFVQGDGGKAALVEAFRRADGGVLLGTTSFWHGVDVPGEALSLVIIDKLPFDVPNDPLIAARIDRLRAAGADPFREYQTPLAVLELKQGLGRLLRTRTDRGLLAVLDPRLLTRGYGRTFLRSLPPYARVRDLQACRTFFEGVP